MKLKKFSSLLRGVAATTAALLTVSTVGYSIAKSSLAIGWVDGYFGIEDRTIYKDWEEYVDGYTIPGSFEGFTNLKGKSYESAYSDVDAFFAAMKANAIKQGEEGFALLKNDNAALPLKNNANIALFGWNCYNLPAGHTGVVADSSRAPCPDKITLASAFAEMEGITVNDTVASGDFTGAMKKASYGNYVVPEVFEAKSTWDIKPGTTAIVAVGRGGGEGANYQADLGGTNGEGNRQQVRDPLALSDAEIAMIDYAKSTCDKVVVLVVSANAMEIGSIAKGGEHEVDAIGFCGIPNVYQYQGIANVLAGKANATGGLTDTYLYDNSYNPATINMGQQQYADTTTITETPDLLGRTGVNYRANNYIVETEGVYVGYKYYETRYYDAMVDPEGTKANDAIGSTKKGEAWDYSNEVVYTFGQSLSYIPYSQKVTEVLVDVAERGKVRATVEITNEGDVDGYFQAQLYVSRPYTQLDKDHKVEKAAIDFLNSAKVNVKAGETATVEIVVPTRYLASWDSMALEGAGTYILDAGDYYFTAAVGAHEAVNNVLAAQEHDTDETTTIGEVVAWEQADFDDKTFSESNGVEVRNQMQNSDINYFYQKDVVTYLSRSDWKATFPKNYTNYVNDSGIESEDPFTLKGAAKQDEWIKELQNAQYKVTPVEDESQWANVLGVKPEGMTEDQTVWQWILSFATSDPDAFNDIHSEQWQAVAAAINLGTALNHVGESGGSSRTFSEIGNPISKQSESVAGYSQNITLADGSKRNIAVASNTLLGSSFNPELGYEWGVIEGEGGLWIQKQNNAPAYTVWGAGLNQHRHAYNGRNSEYMSEDPMLTNRMGEAQFRGLATKGAICGPKHMGFNDQELNRQGNACYMTEQKVRETDTRCYEGALRGDEGNATGVMMSFARIGASNVTNSVGYVNNIMRGEWGFNGIISTDMGQAGYHEVGSMIMASVNEYAGFGSGSVYTDVIDAETGAINYSATIAKATYGDRNAPVAYITFDDARKDPVFAAQARQTALYMIYTLAHSGSGLYVERIENVGEDIVVDPYTINHHDPVGMMEKAEWEDIFTTVEKVSAIATGVLALAWVATVAIPKKEND